MPAGQTAAMLDVVRLGNQGRFVRPGAARLWGGLLFATASEAAVARALDALGVAFFPLAPGRVTGEGGLRVTRELDFLVVHQGVVGVLELDGAPHEGRAAYDHGRDRALRRHGIWVVERVPSAEALRDPAGLVRRFVRMLEHYRRTA